MKISKELRERIQKLEQEQKKQSKELEKLSDLRDMVAIAELEKELAEIGEGLPKRSVKRRAQTEKNIDFAEEARLAAQAKGVKVKGPDLRVDKNIDLSKENLGKGKKPVTARQGFVVCLLFNEAAPSEWADDAGGGWRGKGLGTPYPTSNAAYKKLQELKTKWPDYPIEVRQI